MKSGLFFLILAFAFWSCTSLTDPQQIIDKAIIASGGEKYTNSTIEFDFRERHYIAIREGGKFSYERVFKDSARTIHDYVSNDGFKISWTTMSSDPSDGPAGTFRQRYQRRIRSRCGW